MLLKKRYNLSWEAYLELLAEQDNKCKICSLELSTISEKHTLNAACVDHCHTSGKVRGILCRPCNLVLGNAKDNTEVLKNAIEYLKAAA